MPEKAPLSVSSVPSSPSAPPRVLIADDDTASRNTIAALLSPAGYRLRFATNGKEALAFVEEETPDLVLLDVMMPGLDGFEVCRRLREFSREDYIPIILVTSLDGRKDIVRGLQSGADDFLPKPVYGPELRARVANLLKVRTYHQMLASEFDSARATVDALRQQVLRADRLATLGTFAAGVSHELNNIAQVLRSALEPPSRDVPAAMAEAEEMTHRAALTHVAQHVTELAHTILRMARPTENSRLEAELGQTVKEVRDMLRLTGRIRHARVILVLPQEPCVILANPVHAQQVFLNLISNAADALVHTPEPCIEVGVLAMPGGRIEAWVQDNGPGMSSEVLARIFEPFFTTKASGAGTGLGLPVVKQLVESWGGRILVHSQPGSGTRMVLDIPLASSSTREAPS